MSSLTSADLVPQGGRFATLFQSPVPDRATEFMASLYRPHLLRVERSACFDMSLHGFEMGGLHVGVVRYGSMTRVQLDEGRGCWIFSWLQRGEAQVGRSSACQAAGDAYCLAPDATPELRLSADAELVNLRVEQSDLRAACLALMGIDPGPGLRFQPGMPDGSPAARALQRLTACLAATPDYGHVAGERLNRSLRETVLFELLLAWPGLHGTDLRAPAAVPHTLRRAREYIHAHIDELPTVADVALACGVGARALAKGFARHLGVTPSHYIGDLRLERVRAELLQSAADSVTAVAQAWGFAHAGQFAARYRQRFGERPSDTLRRRQNKPS